MSSGSKWEYCTLCTSNQHSVSGKSLNHTHRRLADKNLVAEHGAKMKNFFIELLQPTKLIQKINSTGCTEV